MVASKRKAGAEAGSDIAAAEGRQEAGPENAESGRERKAEGVKEEKAAEEELKHEPKVDEKTTHDPKKGRSHKKGENRAEIGIKNAEKRPKNEENKERKDEKVDKYGHPIRNYEEDPDYGDVSDEEKDEPVPGKPKGLVSEGIDIEKLLDQELPPLKRPKIAPGLSVGDVAEKHEEEKDDRPKDKERLKLLKSIKTPEDLKKVLEHARPEKEFKVGDVIKVDDLMQTGYEYKLEEPIGKNFADGFEPKFAPKEMLELGVFEGKQINDMIFELPREWFAHALEHNKLSPQGPNEALNYFGIRSRLPLSEWRRKNWVPKHDVRGWFQWYCRYYLGRRTEYDAHEISRWRQLRRHAGQIKAHCKPGDLECRRKQRQALLQWSHDPFL